jgi:transcriptional regulator with XRE-family HTH domain
MKTCERCDKKAVVRGLCPPHYKKLLPGAFERGLWDPVLLNPIGTIRRLQALVAAGYTQADLANRLGMKPCNVSRLMSTERRVHVKTADAVSALFDELQLMPGPSSAARRRGARMGWALPLAWDEDEIDDPAAEPDKSRRRPVSFPERYAEMRELGYGDLQIISKWQVQPASLLRQLHRYRIQPSPALVKLATTQKWQRAKAAS